MKKTTLVIIVLMFCVNSSYAQTPKWVSDTLTGEDEPLLEGTTWGYVDQTTGIMYSHEFRYGGRFVRNIGRPINESENGTWQREGNIVRIKLNIGNGRWIFYEGRYYAQTQKIMLTGFRANNGGTFDVNAWEPIQGSSVVATPTPQTGGTVQPSSPAPAPNIAQQLQQAFQSPLDSGIYGLAGTQATIRLTAIAKSGIFSYTNRQGRTGTGNYQIDENRMTIQMEGYTFVYNVTSRTSFSGNGETWIRTGF
jgi:hypothetical protein